MIQLQLIQNAALKVQSYIRKRDLRQFLNQFSQKSINSLSLFVKE